VNDELKRMWKEAFIAEFKVLTWHFPGGTEENHEKPLDIRSPGRDLNAGHPE
jgi:hypothetical protein